ncbi:MAG TPA: hypothetical protein VEB19_05465 [Gemmatimonadaceae bacterium]|nr:hypothetical protein [Gemmatimonadaceae bacterium]
MKGSLLALLFAAACSSPPRTTPPPLRANVAMDSAQIERLCARPGLVRVGLADCELKDQSAPQIVPLERRP